VHIPDRLSVLGVESAIVLGTLDELDAAGTWRASDGRLCLATDRPETQVAETFLHEIIESLNYALELELKHPQIQALSSGLFGVMRNNRLDFGGERG